MFTHNGGSGSSNPYILESPGSVLVPALLNSTKSKYGFINIFYSPMWSD